MNAVSAQDLTRSADCKIVGCTREALSTRGVYAYLCSEHIAAAKQQRPAPAQRRQSGDTTADKLRGLAQLARDVDKAKQRERKAVDRMRVEKDALEAAEDRYRSALREALGESGGR